MKTGIHIALATAALLASTFGTQVLAQDYPNRPLRFVIPDSPGGVNDRTARMISPALGKALGQNVVVDNRPGAAGIIAWENVAKNSPADGYTIGMAHSGLMTVPLFFKDMRFDTLKDLRQVMIFAEAGIPLVASFDAPFKDFNEMITYAKANPGKLNFGSPGYQSLPTLIIEGIKRRFGLDIVVVVYKAAGDVAPAIYGNQVQLSLFSESSANIGVKAGKMKVLASAAATRSPSFPEAPTLAEVGMKDVATGSIFTIMVARATPQPVFDRLLKASQDMMASTELREQLTKAQVYPQVTLSEEADRKVAALSQFYAGLAKTIGIQPQ
jgi:tripartite-type tricarboxylate transporter receptor subunit TctC